MMAVTVVINLGQSNGIALREVQSRRLRERRKQRGWGNEHQGIRMCQQLVQVQNPWRYVRISNDLDVPHV